MPTATVEIDAFEAKAKALLATVVPKWRFFACKLASKYLGWLLGPGATCELQCEKAIEKFEARVEAIACTGVPGTVGLKMLNQRATPVLGYIPNFGTPPKQKLRNVETRAIHRILHLPYNSLTLSAAAHWFEHGGPSIKSIAILCEAAPLRFAFKHEADLQAELKKMIACHENAVVIRRLVVGELSPSAWATPAIAQHLLVQLRGSSSLFRRLGIPRPRRAPRTAEGLRQARLEGVVADALRELERMETSGRPKSIQAFFAKKMLDGWLEDDFVAVLNRRALALIGEHVQHECWQQVSSLAKQIEKRQKNKRAPGDQRRASELAMPRAAYAFWQHALGTWPTARRYQQELFFCVFGCPGGCGRDDQQHYIRCPRALRVINAITCPPELAATPRARLLGGDEPSRHGMLQIAVLTRLYRLVRMDRPTFAKVYAMHAAGNDVGLFRLLCREGHAIAHDLGIAGAKSAIPR